MITVGTIAFLLLIVGILTVVYKFANSDLSLTQNVYEDTKTIIIYRYLEETTDVSLKLILDGDITCTFPTYKDGRRVIAEYDGTLTDAANLSISPSPDTLICVFMAWKASNFHVELEEQTLSAPERSGFMAVEWDGN